MPCRTLKRNARQQYKKHIAKNNFFNKFSGADKFLGKKRGGAEAVARYIGGKAGEILGSNIHPIYGRRVGREIGEELGSRFARNMGW